jgi:16S rRNA (uracil1498-N3)-methyltransferase
MHRFYVSPERISDSTVSFSDDQRKQIRNVLRLAADDSVVVFDGSGREYVARLDASETGTVTRTSTPSTEPALRLTLVQGLPKGDKIEFVLQKCTEIGVSEFVIVSTERSIPKIDKDKVAGRLQRWRSIVIEAAEQSGRVRVPEISGVFPFREVIDRSSKAQVRFIAWEDQKESALLSELTNLGVLNSLELFIGPEGGFSSEEVAAAVRQGIRSVSLGPRILRTETAAIVASALAIYRG